MREVTSGTVHPEHASARRGRDRQEILSPMDGAGLFSPKGYLSYIAKVSKGDVTFMTAILLSSPLLGSL